MWTANLLPHQKVICCAQICFVQWKHDQIWHSCCVHILWWHCTEVDTLRKKCMDLFVILEFDFSMHQSPFVLLVLFARAFCICNVLILICHFLYCLYFNFTLSFVLIWFDVLLFYGCYQLCCMLTLPYVLANRWPSTIQTDQLRLPYRFNKKHMLQKQKGKVRPRTLPKSFRQKKSRPTILKPEALTATSAPNEEQAPPAEPADPHKQKLRRRYGSAFQPYLKSSVSRPLSCWFFYFIFYSSFYFLNFNIFFKFYLL